MEDIKNPVKAANQLPGIDTQPNDTNHSPIQCDPEYLFSLQWIQELEFLCVRYSGLGVTPDIAGLTLFEAWGLFCWLKGLGS